MGTTSTCTGLREETEPAKEGGVRTFSTTHQRTKSANELGHITLHCCNDYCHY